MSLVVLITRGQSNLNCFLNSDGKKTECEDKYFLEQNLVENGVS